VHENRETLGMPAGNVIGRPAGKGDSHTARMHIPEGSDSGTVPMKQPNKEGLPSAEVVEGRPLVEENTHQFSRRPRQSGARVSQGLAGVRQAEYRLAVKYLRPEPYALRSARTDLCGGRLVRAVPAATG
jgi:hypothetical protein